MHGETREVRASEQLDWHALASYLREHLPSSALAGADRAGGMHVAQFPGGHSNLTYLVRFGTVEFVVRRPPLGTVPAKAHDMAREYRWLAAVHPHFPLAPRPLLLCEDRQIVGSVFYAMERRRGEVVRQTEPAWLEGRPDVRQRVSQVLVDTLAELHTVDVSSGTLATLGKPSGFIARQIAGWTTRWHHAQTQHVPELDALSSWLPARVPPDPDRPAVVHGDYKLDNVMLDPLDRGRIVGVFDWEMSALGDPLLDVGALLAYWSPTAPPEQQNAFRTVTSGEGYLSGEALVDRYARQSGRDVSALPFFEVLALFKVAVVVQQIYYRFITGQTDDPRFASFSERVTYIARRATRLAEAVR